MSSFEIGEMFWGKSLSYPWWPCVIVPNKLNETIRNRKKLGIQYHVQFLGSDYDVCWITDSFLIEYHGKEHFESFVEQQISSNISTQEKVKFDMRMSNVIQALWIQACNDAEIMFLKNSKDRLTGLPQPPKDEEVEQVDQVDHETKSIVKRNPPRRSLTDSNADQSIESKDVIKKPKEKLKAPKRQITRDSDDGDTEVEARDVIGISPKKKRKVEKEPIYKEFDNEEESDNETDTKDVTLKKPKPRRKSQKTLLDKESDNTDKISTDTDIKVKQEFGKKRGPKRRHVYVTDEEDGEVEKDLSKTESSATENDFEDRCFKAYIAKEMTHRLDTMTTPLVRKNIENMLKEQWAALDRDLKLQYINDDASYLGASKSKVSGRNIKIPSKLRLTEDVEKTKRSTPRNRSTCYLKKRFGAKSSSLPSVLSVKTDDSETQTTPYASSQSSNAVSSNELYRDTVSETLWNALTIQDCATEMMRIVLMKALPDVRNICCHCFKSLSPSDKTVHCKGDCNSSYHLSCAVQNKIINSDNVSICVYCNVKSDVCCICHDSRYMKKQSLVKCVNEDCSRCFHVTCMKFMTSIERDLRTKDPSLCPKHSCLTCSIEDPTHRCNQTGQFVTCLKCPVSYHNNLVCIPAGGRIVGKNRIVCYRHFNNGFLLKKSQPLSRCFVCFNEKATLKCCKCRSVFHPPCLDLATYTDLLRDFVCTACKLEQPVFQGQLVWVESYKKWSPGEIVSPISPLLDNTNEEFTKSLTIRYLDSHQYCFANRCELIPFAIGLSVLKDYIDVAQPAVQLAKIKNVLYWNWRCRLRPLNPKKYILIGQSDLMRYSVNNHKSPEQSVNKYQSITENILSESLQKLILPKPGHSCVCTSSTGTCSDNNCLNFKFNIECCDLNCNNGSCNNRIFSTTPKCTPVVISSPISSRGVKVFGTFTEKQLLGVCAGTIIQESEAMKELSRREYLDSVSYIFRMSGDVLLNCEHSGNEWRFLNHSCEPNARLVCRNVSGAWKLGVVTIRSINYEEVTIDYRETIILKYGFVCQCQSSLCPKIISPTSVFATDCKSITPLCCSKYGSVKTPSPPLHISPLLTIRRMTPIKPLSNHDDADNTVTDDRILAKTSCFKCGTHGEFITCDRGNCRKQYHMMCIEKSSKPTGLWLCPIHFCCYCNGAATIFCDNCPISCCTKHGPSHCSHVCTTVLTYRVVEDNKEEKIIKPDKNDSCSEKKESLVVEDVKVIESGHRELVDGLVYGEKEETVIEEHGTFNDDDLECVVQDRFVVEMESLTNDEGTESNGTTKSIAETKPMTTSLIDNKVIVEQDTKVEKRETGHLHYFQETVFSVREETIGDDELTLSSSEKEYVIIEGEQTAKEVDDEHQFSKDEIDNECIDTEEFSQDSVARDMVVISKDHLYEACGLVPVIKVGEDICPSTHDMEVSQEDSTSAHYEGSHDDVRSPMDFRCDDVRFEVVPGTIEDMKDTIISPCIIDE